MKHAGVIATTGGGGVGVGKPSRWCRRHSGSRTRKTRAPATTCSRRIFRSRRSSSLPLPSSSRRASTSPLRRLCVPTTAPHAGRGPSPLPQVQGGGVCDPDPAASGRSFAWCPPPLAKVNTVTNFPGDTACTATHADFKAKHRLQGGGSGLRRHDEPGHPPARTSAAWPSASAAKLALQPLGGGESLPTGARLCEPPSHHAAVRRLSTACSRNRSGTSARCSGARAWSSR